MNFVSFAAGSPATLSPSSALSPAKPKHAGKRVSLAPQPAPERGSSRPASRLPSKAGAAASKAEKGHSTKAAGSRLVRVVEPDDQSSVAPSSTTDPTCTLDKPDKDKDGAQEDESKPAEGPPSSPQLDAPSSETTTKMVGRAPAFTGDPRNKGLTIMMAALGNRRRKSSAV